MKISVAIYDMLCDACHQRPVETGSDPSRTLCAVCAHSPPWSPPTAIAPMIAFESLRLLHGSDPMAAPLSTRCEACGYTFARYQESGLLGCASCYTSFVPQLDTILRCSQGGRVRHDGKRPARSGRSLPSHDPVEPDAVPQHTDPDLVRSLDVEWMRGSGPQDEVVVATRVRVARNLQGCGFPCAACGPELDGVARRVLGAVRCNPYFRSFVLVDLARLSALELHTLVEKHLASPLLVSNTQHGAKNRFLLLGPRGMQGLMVNEEDHLRLQCLVPGLDPEAAWQRVSAMDDALESALDYAWSEQLGYVTASPSNVGTALRVSMMLHLPALALMNAIDVIKAQIAGQVGLAVRGVYGEGTEVAGNMLQISNQISLGPREADLTAHMRGVVSRIVEQELNARSKLRREFSARLGDKVWRSLGILRHAQLVSTAEAFELLSMVRLGVELGILPHVSRARLNALAVSIRPATLQVLMGETADPIQVDMTRARRIRQELSEEA